MALSGFFYGTTSNQYVKPKIQWFAEQSIEGNYSDITAILTYSRTNTGYKTESTWYGGITIDGVRQNGAVFATVTYNSNTEVFRCTQRVYHDALGCRQVSISADGYFYNTKTQDTAISATLTLDQIPRAAKPTATDANIGGVSTVTVTGLQDGYSYTMQVQFGGVTGYLDTAGNLLTDAVKLTWPSIPFTIPESFYYEIPDAPSGVCTLTCATYFEGQPVGVPQTTCFTATAAKEVCAPRVVGSAQDVNPVTLALTGDGDKWVLHASDVLCTMVSAGQYGAWITEKKIGGVALTADVTTVYGVSAAQIVFQVTDSRGYESAVTVSASEVIPYVPLSLSAAAARTDPTSGNAVLTLRGNGYGGLLGKKENILTVFYAVNGGPTAAQQIPIEQDSTYCAEILLSGLDYEQEHTVWVRAADLVGTTEEKSLRIGKGIPVFDWGEDCFAFHVPVELQKGMTVWGNSLLDCIYPVGSVYWNADGGHPAELLGGTWELLPGSETAAPWKRTA